jgi:hypothetical protein
MKAAPFRFGAIGPAMFAAMRLMQDISFKKKDLKKPPRLSRPFSQYEGSSSSFYDRGPHAWRGLLRGADGYGRLKSLISIKSLASGPT